MSEYPFIITKRKESPYYYVRFKNNNGKYLSWKSTGKADKQEATRLALQWYSTGKKNADSVDTMQNKATVKKEIALLNSDTQKYLLEQLKKQGVIKSYVMTGSKTDITLVNYLLDFWNYDTSDYVKEKLRRKQGIGKSHCMARTAHVKKYWEPYFKNKLLGEITRQDIKDFMQYLDGLPLSFGTKNAIIHGGTTAIKYAYQNELIDRDLTQGLIFYSGKYNERAILTPEIVQAVFSLQWNDNRAKLANMLAMVTGLRAGEIKGLKYKSLGQGRLYITNSWSLKDGLKSTKNGENRIVEVPFIKIMQALKELAETNPWNEGLDGYVFYATIPNYPMDSKEWLRELRDNLQKIGISKEECKKYTFHAWRHYFTAYMKDKINDKLLQEQTGHKTHAMLEHYADHVLTDDEKKLCNAQVSTFTPLLPNDIEMTFDTKKINTFVSEELKTKYKIK